ncbi:hypothetical protein ACIQF6_28275 [Kitasatospora sp. NPDC092948]|uniref:hypothetical protein n=1 Tax=Kitasatospora sp. NPDC092948 TaxID=3364088 RepID=UPI00382BFC3B
MTITEPRPADTGPQNPAAVAPRGRGRSGRAAPSRVALALAHPDQTTHDVPLRERAVAASLRDRHPRLAAAMRGASDFEEAAVRHAVQQHDQVLHIGFGAGVHGREPHQWWQRPYGRCPNVIAVTTCQHALERTRAHCEASATLLHEPGRRLHRILGNPFQTTDFCRPVGVVLAAQRSPRRATDELLKQLLGRLVPGSTLALTGIALDDIAERRRLRERWARYTDQRLCLLHGRRPAGLLYRLRHLEQVPGALAAHLPPAHRTPDSGPGIRAFGAVYRITARDH